jgi:glyoxylase-like metal-dependent hydrolase (beta-lactamase superfamily II)
LVEWATSCSILACVGEGLIVDPAAEPERMLAAVAGATLKAILLAHAHPEPLQALGQVRQASGAPLGLHPSDVSAFGLQADVDLHEGDVLTLGGHELQVVHTPAKRL